MIENNIKKYGVPHHSQNSDVSERMFMAAYKNKKYTMPTGKIIDYQGYENFGLDDLLNIEHILEEDIITKYQYIIDTFIHNNHEYNIFIFFY